MANNYFERTETTRGIREVGNIVDDSAEMALIRATIDEKGLDPIWVQLISQFGSLMYARGHEASTAPLSRSRARLHKTHAPF